MESHTCNIRTVSADGTQFVAQELATRLKSTDTIVLSGSIGAGKSVFARALIGTLLASTGKSEDIPSPTYTLVQAYEANFEIWHIDLYRLHDASEAVELGLEDVLGDVLCVIEWGERIEHLLPASTIWVTLKSLSEHPDVRLLRIRTNDSQVAKRIAGIAASRD